jgi:hypothetical protein
MLFPITKSVWLGLITNGRCTWILRTMILQIFYKYSQRE